jgi:hypothetical protein
MTLNFSNQHLAEKTLSGISTAGKVNTNRNRMGLPLE